MWSATSSVQYSPTAATAMPRSAAAAVSTQSQPVAATEMIRHWSSLASIARSNGT